MCIASTWYWRSNCQVVLILTCLLLELRISAQCGQVAGAAARESLNLVSAYQDEHRIAHVEIDQAAVDIRASVPYAWHGAAYFSLFL